jgi:uncharacterized RDD family membrane protein YckC
MDLRPEAAGRPGAPRYAGFWIRVFANVLDVLWMGAVNMALAVALGAWLAVSPPGSIGSVSAGVSEAVAQGTAVFLAVLVIAFWIVEGATPSKMMCGLRIIDAASGGHPTAWQCIGRYFMGLIALALVGIGYLWIAIDARKQGWHDKVVRTLVVRRERAA